MPSKSWLRRFEVNENDKTTVYLLGDSITQGLGSKKVNFTGKLADLLGEGYEIVNLAYTGTTIDYALGLLDEGKIAPGGVAPCASCSTETWTRRYGRTGRARCFLAYQSASRAAAC